VSSTGELIEIARRAAGLTQGQLSEQVGITQAALSRYEHGLREPSDQILEHLADRLGVTMQFLQRPELVRGGLAVDAHMRRRATAQVGVWRRLEARLNMQRLHARRLFEHVDLHAVQRVPSFDHFETRAADAARMTRMQWGMPIGPVRNLTQWIESAGVLIIEEDFQTPRVDGLSQWVDDHPIIMSNSRTPTDRKRWTLAHELGHLVLHISEMGDDPEAEANEFAAEFLMPANVIKPQLRQINLSKLRDLKRTWMVSMQALINRAASLGTITSGQRTSLYKQIGARGWRTHEPLSDDLPPEAPRLAQAIGQELHRQGLSPAERASITGIAEGSADDPYQVADRRLRAL
jgi:Zn-dependent peptidase ImmA (M78 family)/transcriptional regulator with XRE-family HTH domain